MKTCIPFFLILILNACNSTVELPSLPDGFEVTTVSGTNVQRAIKLDPSTGMIAEEGEIRNGKISGAWTSYSGENHLVKIISNFIDGKRNGIYLELTDKGQLKIQASYLDDQLHGRRITFAPGSRIEKEEDYENGQLNGYVREYNNRRKLSKEMQFVDGKLNGTFKYFDEEGNLTLEYEYKNGDKVSGGPVKK